MGTDMKPPNPVEALLQEPEQQEALAQLLRDLPLLVERLEQLEKSVSFAEHVLQDKTTILPYVKEAEQKIRQTGLTKAHIDALLEIARLLPEVAPVAKQSVSGLLFAKAVLEDERTMHDLLNTRPRIPVLSDTNRLYEAKKNKKQKLSLRRIWRLLTHPIWKDMFLYVESLLETIMLNRKKRG